MNHYAQDYKGYFIKPHPTYPASYVIVTTGRGGKIPDVLDGLFTSRLVAMSDIDHYLDNKTVKEKKNAETINAGGSK